MLLSVLICKQSGNVLFLAMMIGAGVRTSAREWELSVSYLCSGVAGVWLASWRQTHVRTSPYTEQPSKQTTQTVIIAVQCRCLTGFPIISADVYTFNALIAAAGEVKEKYTERWELAEVRNPITFTRF